MARGSTIKRGKGWSYIIRHPALDKPEWSRQQPTKADAERLMTARLAQLDQGLGIGGGDETLAVYLAAWLAGRKRIRVRTRQSYQTEIDKRIVPHLGHVLLTKLTPANVASWHGKLRKAGVSDRGIAYADLVLSMALRQAVRWGHIVRNPCDLVERPRPEKIEYQWWEPEEAQKFLLATADHDDHALYRLALAGCLRRGELLALEWRDVDWQRSRVVVRRTLTASGVAGMPYVSGDTKSGRVRVVPLDAETMRALRQQQEREAFKRARSDRWVENGLVFCGRDGKIATFQAVRVRFKKAIARAGVPDIRFHDLRHTGATLLLQAGVPLVVVQERLGHASISTTARVYAHVTETMQDDAAETMGRMLGGG